MFISNKPLPSIAEDDLLDLISNKVPESKTTDYKLHLPGNSDDDKKEFLADVSSFANTIGGHLIFGMDEIQGIASSLPGLSDIDPDKEILRLENIIRDGAAPRIAVSSRPVHLQNGNCAIVIYVPKSWLSPHMVTYRGTSRFFARHSAGKYQLDVQEIRQAFLLSESTTERIKNYRLDRVIQIGAGNTPIPVGEHAQLVLHVIPLSAFQTNQLIDIPIAGQTYHKYFGEYRFSSHFNLDGILLHMYFRDGGAPLPEYLQVLRQSHVEYVNGYLLGSDILSTPNINRIRIEEVEREIIKISKNILDYQQSLGIETPTILLLTHLTQF